MAVSIAQYVDLLFKKLQGVAKTANSTVKSASNESIASPAFLRGDIIWMQSDQIPATAQAVSGIANARINGNSVECVADTTVPPIGGVRPTWLSNVEYWIPQELGATWLPKVFVGPSAAANIQSTGTQIFSAGIGGVGEYYFDTQAGVLNFIGETIPTVLTAGNVVYISGYEYVGDLGVQNIPDNANIGNLQISNTTITTTLANGNITLTATGTQFVQVTGTGALVIPTGNTAQRPSPEITGMIRINTQLNQIEGYDGTNWVAGSGTGVTNQTFNGDGSTVAFTLNRSTTSAAALIMLNGVVQLPGTAYNISPSPGTNLVFTEAPAISDVIDVRYL
jgi:hypothetical protein